MKFIRFLSILLAVSVINLTHAQAQSVGAAIFGPPKPAASATDATAPVKDDLGRVTPRGTLSGFIHALSESDYAKAASFLNLAYLPKRELAAQGPQLAKDLQTLMDNGSRVTPSTMVSDDPFGNKDDGLTEDLERLGTLNAGGESVELIAEKVTPSDNKSPVIWLISQETMKRVPELTEHITESYIDRALPQKLLVPKVMGVPVGHWAAMLGLAGLAFILAWLVIKSITFVTKKVWKNDVTSQKKHVIDAFELPTALYVSVWFFVLSASRLGISVVARQYFSHLVIIVAWVSLALLIWKLIDVIAETSQKKLILKGKYGALSGVQFFRRTAKFIFLAIAVFITLSTLGIDVTTGLAALGIGGLAIAFGAQKTVENFIGSIMVIFDQPIRIGDYCKVGDISGTIEDIGMRSTRIRTLDRTVVTIPNGDFSAQRIENFAPRDQFRLYQKLAIRLDASADQLRFLIVEIRSLLFAHPKVDTKSANVKLIGWGDYSTFIEVAAYVVTRSNDEFMEAREDIFLRMMDIIEKSGTTLTTPATPFAQWNQPVDATTQARATAEQKMRDLAGKGQLPLPKFDTAQIDALKNTLEYPQASSAVYKGRKE